MTCNHEEMYWYCAEGACNEEGWKCVDCDLRPGEPPGYSPSHDRSRLHTKVWSILDDLHNAGIVYISNSTMGEALGSAVVETVRASGNLDQYSIVLAIMQAMTPDHAAYWRKIGEGVIAGKDERDRCHCGALATVFATCEGKTTRTCFEHTSKEW